MNNGFRNHRAPSRGVQRQTPAAPAWQKAPLGDDRFRALLSEANAFFAEAETDKVAQRIAVIAEIKERMATYGLSHEDLSD